MNPFVEETRVLLEDRKREVSRHLEFAKVLIDSKADHLAKYQGGEFLSIAQYKIDRSLVKTISATGYLLLYNLIESVMTSVLHAVHQQLQSDDITFSDLSGKLQTICLKNFKDSFGKDSAIEHGPILINEALVWLGYQKNRHWSGNIDMKRIREKAATYGIEVLYTEDDKPEIAQNFFDIRQKRNDLAHGELSFEQCGQDTPIELLISCNNQAYKYLNAVINGVELYLSNKKYLAAS